MREIAQGILGIYQFQYDIDGNLLDGLGAVDWTYIFGGLLFCIAVYSLFRLIGSLLKGL